jgi:hypothetical protein
MHEFVGQNLKLKEDWLERKLLIAEVEQMIQIFEGRTQKIDDNRIIITLALG